MNLMGNLIVNSVCLKGKLGYFPVKKSAIQQSEFTLKKSSVQI